MISIKAQRSLTMCDRYLYLRKCLCAAFGGVLEVGRVEGPLEERGWDLGLGDARRRGNGGGVREGHDLLGCRRGGIEAIVPMVWCLCFVRVLFSCCVMNGGRRPALCINSLTTPIYFRKIDQKPTRRRRGKEGELGSFQRPCPQSWAVTGPPAREWAARGRRAASGRRTSRWLQCACTCRRRRRTWRPSRPLHTRSRKGARRRRSCSNTRSTEGREGVGRRVSWSVRLSVVLMAHAGRHACITNLGGSGTGPQESGRVVCLGAAVPNLRQLIPNGAHGARLGGVGLGRVLGPRHPHRHLLGWRAFEQVSEHHLT